MYLVLSTVAVALFNVLLLIGWQKLGLEWLYSAYAAIACLGFVFGLVGLLKLVFAPSYSTLLRRRQIVQRMDESRFGTYASWLLAIGSAGFLISVGKFLIAAVVVGSVVLSVATRRVLRISTLSDR